MSVQTQMLVPVRQVYRWSAPNRLLGFSGYPPKEQVLLTVWQLTQSPFHTNKCLILLDHAPASLNSHQRLSWAACMQPNGVSSLIHIPFRNYRPMWMKLKELPFTFKPLIFAFLKSYSRWGVFSIALTTGSIGDIVPHFTLVLSTATGSR